jgi:hypothetical protein
MKKYIIFVLVFVHAYSIGAMPPVTEGDTQTFLGPIKIVGEMYRWVDNILSIGATETTGNLNMYVSTTGDDNNTCLSIGQECLTIQGAIDKLPKILRSAVTINVGEGTFSSFIIRGFYITSTSASSGSLNITGALGAPTLTTGTVSGTATGGTTSTCIDAGQTWTVNELRGKWVHVGSSWRVITSNTGTTINLLGPLSATCSGKAYSLEEPKSIINSGNSTRINVSRNVGTLYSQINLTNLKSSGGTTGFSITYNNFVGTSISRCWADAATNTGVSISDNTGSASNDAYDIVITSATVYGMLVQRLGSPGFASSFRGVFIYGGGSSTGYGFSLVGCTGSAYAPYVWVEARTAGTGVYCSNNQYAEFTGILTVVGSAGMKDCVLANAGNYKFI